MLVGRALHGRQEEAASLVEAVLSDGDGCEGIGVIPIVGIGGIGKTTLARHVFDSLQVREAFSVRAWFTVSQHRNFDAKQPLQGKKYLIVIDDLWDESQADWSSLERALIAGSKIVVTTRKESVAIAVKTTETLVSLKPISDAQCWSVFCERAGVEPDAIAGSEWERIGRELVRSCHGVPLAAALLGGALANTDNLERWKEKSEDVRSVMMHCYNDLTSELKRCFSVFAMFPEDCPLYERVIVSIWVAEGMVKWEETGDYRDEHRYYKELKRRSLLESGEFDDRMHDIVRELACEIANVFDGNETRRLYVDGDQSGVDFKHLRTMVAVSSSLSHNDLDGAFSKMKYLRALILEECYCISELPESIGELA